MTTTSQSLPFTSAITTPPPSLRAKRGNPSFEPLFKTQMLRSNNRSKDGLLRFARNDGGGVAIAAMKRNDGDGGNHL